MPDILIETAGAVTTVAFNRPEKKNAITDGMYDAFADGLTAAAADETVETPRPLG